jgi:hypothetical protein
VLVEPARHFYVAEVSVADFAGAVNWRVSVRCVLKKGQAGDCHWAVNCILDPSGPLPSDSHLVRENLGRTRKCSLCAATRHRAEQYFCLWRLVWLGPPSH